MLRNILFVVLLAPLGTPLVTAPSVGLCDGSFKELAHPCENCEITMIVPSISDAACEGDCAWAVAGIVNCTNGQVQWTIPFDDSGILHCDNEHRVVVPCSPTGELHTVGFSCKSEGC